MDFWVIVLLIVLGLGLMGSRTTGKSTRGTKGRNVRGKSPRQPPGPNIEIDETREGGNEVEVTIRAPHFFGFGSRSPNGRYVVAARDGHRDGDRDRWINGEYVLIEDGAEVLRDRLERPQFPVVANNGTFALADWLRFDGSLQGILYAFRPSGEQLLARRFEANLDRPTISPDGRYVAISTLNADNDDGNRTALFDLAEGTLLWKRPAPLGQVPLDIDPDQGVLGADLRETNHLLERINLGRFHLRLSDGELLEPEALEEARLRHGHPFHLKSKIIELRKTMPEAEDPQAAAREILGWVDAYLERDPVTHNRTKPKEKAPVFRARGEALEQLEDQEGAIAAYEQALALDDKVGVKRRLKQLQG